MCVQSNTSPAVVTAFFTKPAKLRQYLPGTLQQLTPAGTAVYNKQDRRRVTDGGRATEVERRSERAAAGERRRRPKAA